MKTEDNEKGPGAANQKPFITFSPKYTAINAGVSFAGLLVYIFTIAENRSFSSISINVWPTFIGGLLFTLAATFSNQINCCRLYCCVEPFEMGALLVSSPHTPFVLGPDGQLRREATEMDSNVKQEQEIKEGESKQEEVSNIFGSDGMEEKKEETNMEEK